MAAFNPLLIVVYLLAFLPTVAILLWIFLGLGEGYSGFSFSWQCASPDNCDAGPVWQTFNWHPLLMVMAFGTFLTQALCAFKLMPFDHLTNKLIHAAFQTLALIFSITAFTVIVLFKQRTENYNFYTVHSWLGLLTLVLFIFNYLGGFTSFLFPKLPERMRKVIRPFHIYAGFCIYVLSMLSISTGINDRELICGWAGCGMSDQVYTYNWIGANLVIVCIVISAAAAFWAHRPPTDLNAYKKHEEHVEMFVNEYE